MTNNKQQTVVDRIVNLLNKEGFAPVLTEEEIKSFKEMEKKQHADTWDDSRLEDMGDNYIGKQESFNEYYNENYGGNK